MLLSKLVEISGRKELQAHGVLSAPCLQGVLLGIRSFLLCIRRAAVQDKCMDPTEVTVLWPIFSRILHTAHIRYRSMWKNMDMAIEVLLILFLLLFLALERPRPVQKVLQLKNPQCVCPNNARTKTLTREPCYRVRT